MGDSRASPISASVRDRQPSRCDRFEIHGLSLRPYAFDALSIEGEDLTGLLLLERKSRLLAIMPTIECRLLYLDQIEQRGCDLFRAACERDLEGIVAKWAGGTYRTDGRATSWVRIKNRDYTQMRDRHELFASRQAGPRRAQRQCA